MKSIAEVLEHVVTVNDKMITPFPVYHQVLCGLEPEPHTQVALSNIIRDALFEVVAEVE